MCINMYSSGQVTSVKRRATTLTSSWLPVAVMKLLVSMDECCFYIFLCRGGRPCVMIEVRDHSGRWPSVNDGDAPQNAGESCVVDRILVPGVLFLHHLCKRCVLFMSFSALRRRVERVKETFEGVTDVLHFLLQELRAADLS